MNHTYYMQLKDVEAEKETNERKFKNTEVNGEEIFHLLNESKNVLTHISDGYRGDSANSFLLEKDELFGSALVKNAEYIEYKRDEYEKVKRNLSNQEEEILEKQRKDSMEGTEDDN